MKRKSVVIVVVVVVSFRDWTPEVVVWMAAGSESSGKKEKQKLESLIIITKPIEEG